MTEQLPADFRNYGQFAQSRFSGYGMLPHPGRNGSLDPIRVEFKRGLVSLQLGKPFRDTMKEMSYRIRTPDFKLLTQAIFISQDVRGQPR